MSSSVKIRRPFVGELVTVYSPEDPEVAFTIKRCTNRENIQRKNMASTVRIVQEENGSQRFVQERDFPVGDMELESIALGLDSWNLHDENKNPVPVNRETIPQYTSPAEYDFLYKAILELNPMWRGGGEAEVKKP